MRYVCCNEHYMTNVNKAVNALYVLVETRVVIVTLCTM